MRTVCRVQVACVPSAVLAINVRMSGRHVGADVGDGSFFEGEGAYDAALGRGRNHVWSADCVTVFHPNEAERGDVFTDFNSIGLR